MEEKRYPKRQGKNKLPRLPGLLGGWIERLTEEPHDPNSAEGSLLEATPFSAYSYINGFEERVGVLLLQVETANQQEEVDALYPRETYGRTAQNTIKPAPGRLDVADSFSLVCQVDDTRIMVQRWVRLADGSEMARFPADFTPSPENTACVVLCHTEVRAWDPLAVQARRNLQEIAPLINDALRKAMGKTPRPVSLPPLKPTGDEMEYLTSPLTDPTPGAGKNLLPLTKGNIWQLHSVSPEGVVYRWESLGDYRKDGVVGTELRLAINGVPVAREIYRREGPVTLLAAASGVQGPMPDGSDAPLAIFAPAIPLWKEPAALGESVNWSGNVILQGKRMAAKGISRVSGKERVRTPAGLFTTYLIETIVETKDWHYQTLTWFSPAWALFNAIPWELGRARCWK